MKIIDLCSFDPWCEKKATWSVILSNSTRQAPPILVCDTHRRAAQTRAAECGVTCNVYSLDGLSSNVAVDGRPATKA